MASTPSSPEQAPSAAQDAAVPVPVVENAQAVAAAPPAPVIEAAVAQPVPAEPIEAVAARLDEMSDEGGDDGDETGEPTVPGQELTEDQKYAKEVRQKWRNMTDTELRETMAKPIGAAELVRAASQMQEEQLHIIAPFMTDAQIASTIPSLQLQQQNSLVLGFTATQVRHAVRSIPAGDRQLLVSNIALITGSETDPSQDEEVQGIIGFIDPLAMGTFFFFHSPWNTFRPFCFEFSWKFPIIVEFSYLESTLVWTFSAQNTAQFLLLLAFNPQNCNF